MIRSRRDFLAAGAAGGIGILTFSPSGCERLVSPAEARMLRLPFRTLSGPQVRTLDTLGEALLPGSSTAGLAHYLDQQLSGSAADSMLMIKYLNVGMPAADFYRNALTSIDAAAQHLYVKPTPSLTPQQRHDLVGQLAAGSLKGWSGPPAGLVYFVLRCDAVDVMYGTTAGFEALGVPYMPHIPPPSRWGE